MKILSAEQMRQADRYTIDNEPVASIGLMERAAEAFCDKFTELFHKAYLIKIFTGHGNNGGDGLAIGRILHNKGYRVQLFDINHSSKTSEDYRINKEKLLEKGIPFTEVSEKDKLPGIESEAIIIDALLGSGLTRPLEGFLQRVVRYLNKCNEIKVAVDIPTGLFADDNTENNLENILVADYTFTFQLPKLSFLTSETGIYVGDFYVLDIGLMSSFIHEAKTDYYYFTIREARKIYNLYANRGKFSHKGHFGHGLLVAGSYGKIGAAVLASEAALRAGLGLLTVHIPACGYSILQTAVPDAMVNIDEHETMFSGIDAGLLDQFKAIGIGPGTGTKSQTQEAFKNLVKKAKCPLVIDADGLNILGLNKHLIYSLPFQSILTPHPKEFERISGARMHGKNLIELQKNFALKYGIYLVLKGAHTSIACPDGTVYFNSSGNPGLAKGGTGDTLTGIILGLMCQQYSPKEAALMGVYLHGMTGDIIRDELQCAEGLIARDIPHYLHKAFYQLGKNTV